VTVILVVIFGTAVFNILRWFLTEALLRWHVLHLRRARLALLCSLRIERIEARTTCEGRAGNDFGGAAHEHGNEDAS